MPMEKVVEYGVFYKIIFDHDFAKAFFVQEYKGGKMVVNPEHYLNCLSEMAKEKNPIKYLERYL